MFKMSAKCQMQRARNPRSLRSERFRLLWSLRDGEGVTAMTEAEVSGSLSLVGVSGGEGSVVGETQEGGQGARNMVGETRESEGRGAWWGRLGRVDRGRLGRVEEGRGPWWGRLGRVEEGRGLWWGRLD